MNRFRFIRTLIIFLSIFLTDISGIQASISSAFASTDSVAPALQDDDDDGSNLTDEVKEDILQPIQYIDTVGLKLVSRQSTLQKIADENPKVPTSLQIDKTKSVGEIPIMSELSPTGSRTYNVPIDVYPGMKDFQPRLSINYDCHRGNSYLGKGWYISGLPIIYRAGRSIYYDGHTSGVKLDDSDSFLLDGVRLLSASDTDHNLYETELGNVMVRSYTQGETVIYFEVFYPDGNKGIFGFTDSDEDRLYYPITSLTDLYGNEIKYSYSFSNNLYHISSISYNGASILFMYDEDRDDPIISYAGGEKIIEGNLLSRIECRLGSTVLGSYNLSYSYQTDQSGHKCNALLSEIGYTCDNFSLNPIKFYYGTGSENQTFSNSKTLITDGYSTDDPDKVKIVKGRFNYTSNNDGIIILPNCNPYSPDKSNYCCNNIYEGSEKIFVYSSLSSNTEYLTDELSAGEGFVDILCADLQGKNEDYIIKINNTIEEKRDILYFDVYASNAYKSLSLLYSRRFDMGYAYDYAYNKFTTRPKYFYTGDFDGDGKMEILAVFPIFAVGSSKCLIFDLENDNFLQYDNPFSLNINIFDWNKYNAEEAANLQDKVIVMDYDGDGKTDLCHIAGDGLSVFTFDTSGDSPVITKVYTQEKISKNYLENKMLLTGEFNGDGMMDLIISPSSKQSSTEWEVYFSMGNGQFDRNTFTFLNRTSNDKDNFFVQDIDGDGKTDIIFYEDTGIEALLTRGDIPATRVSCNWDAKSILIPANLNSHNKSFQLIGLNNGTVNKYSYSVNTNMESLLTGMSNSYGVIEKNDYILLDDPVASYFYYTKGRDAVFPYVNLLDPLPVTAITTYYLNGEVIDQWSNSYSNAVFHCQGKGFCGFSRIYSLAYDGRFLARDFSPYGFGTIKSETTLEQENTYEYSITTNLNKVSRVALSGKTEKDLVKGISSTTTYVNDTYGFPTSETTVFSDNSSEENIYSYYHNSSVGSGYQLGFLRSRETTTLRNGGSCTEGMIVPSFSKRLPYVVLLHKNGSTVSQTTYVYDTHGMPTIITEKPYLSNRQYRTTLTYDCYGRSTSICDPLGKTLQYSYDSKGLLKNLVDKRGETSTFVYDAFGRLAESSYPDGTERQTTYSWSDSLDKSVYIISHSFTGIPDSTFHYDALNRLVQTGEKRFDGSVKYTGFVYDKRGNLVKSSLPARDTSPQIWNTFSYDIYGRLTKAAYASGKTVTWKYKGTSVTENDGSSSVTTQYDVTCNPVSVTDESGTISYEYTSDGHLFSIEAPDNVTTLVEYDVYGRRTGMTDPSLGYLSWEYDSSGNIVSGTDANGNTTRYTYDIYGRLTKKACDEFTTVYEYSADGDLLSMTTDNGTSSVFKYDSHGRIIESLETGTDSIWLKKNFTYENGNVASVSYTSQSGLLATEQREYANGFLSNVVIDGESTIFQLTAENNFGQPTAITTDNVTRQYGYSDLGTPVRRRAFTSNKTLQDFIYVFDDTTGNLTSRIDNIRNLSETFEYDNLNRLIGFNGETVEYSANGNILYKSDAGDFVYGHSTKPYAITGINATVEGLPTDTQNISYTSFSRPSALSENGLQANFTYNGNLDRERMTIAKDGKNTIDRHYLGGCYEIDTGGIMNTERLYILGDCYSAPAVIINTYNPLISGRDTLVQVQPQPYGTQIAVLSLENGSLTPASLYGKKTYLILRDFLGSITHVVTSGGAVTQELSYDAWGRQRDPSTLEPYGHGEEPSLFLGRGYTGHEHLPQFGLINMNARLYDPLTGRFLSPDPNVQAPFWLQNLNRYSYAMNSPLCYIDEDGELIWAIIGTAAVIGGVVNVANHWDAISAAGGWRGFWKGLGYFAIGAGAGGIGAAVGVGAAVGFGSMLGVTAASLTSATTGFIPGFIYGASNGFAEGLLLRTSNSLMEGESFGNSLVNGLKGSVVDAAFGGLSGGVIGGVKASNQNLNILDGSEKTATKYTGYYGFDDEGIVRYVGITKRDWKIRAKEHLNSNTERANLIYQPQDYFDSLLEARIWEQTKINLHGMKKFGGKLLNMRNEIARKYWKKLGIKP